MNVYVYRDKLRVANYVVSCVNLDDSDNFGYSVPGADSDVMLKLPLFQLA